MRFGLCPPVLPPRNLPCYNSGAEVFFRSADRDFAKEITEGAKQRKTMER